MKLELVRISVIEHGAFGALLKDGAPFVCTLERTFGADNKVLIPDGRHLCTRDHYYKGGYPTFEIQVEGSGIEPGKKHDRVLFHAGNVEEHSRGCILTGKTYTYFKGIPGIGSSRDAHAKFMNVLRGLDEFTLHVSTCK